LRNAILFKALIAFSACHLNITTAKFQHLDTVYHASCVDALLTALNDASFEFQEDYLAATCLLRSYEILNGTIYLMAYYERTNRNLGDMRQQQNHLLGAYSFATSRPIDLNTRGLPQAGTWNYLREEITVALESRRQVRFSPGFLFFPNNEMPDDMWANAITFILAKTINLYFAGADSEEPNDRNRLWHKLASDTASWRKNLPHSFRPFSTASKSGNVFESIWLLRPWHGKSFSRSQLTLLLMIMICTVAAEQYYSVTEILLALSKPFPDTTASTSTEEVQSRDVIIHHALRICGLAYTNDNVSARVNAFGPLAFCMSASLKRFHC